MALLRKLNEDEKRNVRHWAMEFVVVVAGVLLALWLQEWVESRQSLENMRAAEDAVHDEVRASLTSLIWREAISKCHRDRAELLKSKLLSDVEQWPGIRENVLLAPQSAWKMGTVVPGIYQRPNDTFTTSAWDSALATGALMRMDRRRFSRLVALYDQIHFLNDMRLREDEAASKLAPLVFPIKLTPEVKAEMLQALYNLDRTRFMFAFIGPSDFALSMRELGWNDKSQVDQWIRDDAAENRRRGVEWRPCVAPARNPFDGP